VRQSNLKEKVSKKRKSEYLRRKEYNYKSFFEKCKGNIQLFFINYQGKKEEEEIK
jgi:hypothetical protein